MTGLTLFHMTHSRSSTALWMLEEIGEPYDVHLLRMAAGENKAPEFLAINPMGKVPALRHGDVIVTELAAVLMYLAETYPAAALDVPRGDPGRGAYLMWHCFVLGVLEPAVMDELLARPAGPTHAIGYGDLNSALDRLDKGLRPGPYLLGNRFTGVDVAVGAALQWALASDAVPARPSFTDYVVRVTSRPAFRRANAKDDALAEA